jgi:hypothetical protein
MAFAFDERAIGAAFSQPDNDGTFSGEFGTYLRAIAGRRPIVMFAFPPKAAGTFLRSAAIAAVDGQLRRVVHAQGGRDGQPYLPMFIAYYLGGLGDAPLVTHVHMQALPANRHFIEALDLKPIVMLRSIPDMLASYWDMLEADETARRDGLNCSIPDFFPAMSRGDKADFLVDMLGPWYAGYFATWLDYAEQDPARVLLLHFHDFVREPMRALERALRHSGLPQPEIICREAIDEIWRERAIFRFNRGEERRGRSYFSWRHFDRLARMLSYYPITPECQAELLS